MLTNLVSNACDAIPGRGNIWLATRANGGAVTVSVRDDGAGIPAALRDRIFDPFFTTKGMGAGTGLGLSLVHGIVTDLGGGIEVVSAPGAGTRFIIYIPWFGRVAAHKELDAPLLHGDGERAVGHLDAGRRKRLHRP